MLVGVCEVSITKAISLRLEFRTYRPTPSPWPPKLDVRGMREVLLQDIFLFKRAYWNALYQRSCWFSLTWCLSFGDDNELVEKHWLYGWHNGEVFILLLQFTVKKDGSAIYNFYRWSNLQFTYGVMCSKSQNFILNHNAWIAAWENFLLYPRGLKEIAAW